MFRYVAAVAFILGVFSVSAASAQTIITQAKALAGNVTPGDTAGYPITISQPGAYVLGGNLIVPSGQYGLFLGASNIDLDLDGFLITGNGVGTFGIVSNRTEGRIHDGFVAAFSGSGIYLRANGWTIENMQIVRNGGSGIDAVDSGQITLQNSLVADNRRYGIDAGDSGLFKNNRIQRNGSFGISCNESCHAEGNVVDLNNYGIVFNSGMAIGNTITRNTVFGLWDNTGNLDFGYANNMLINNNKNVVIPNQVGGLVEIHPNTCAGKPC